MDPSQVIGWLDVSAGASGDLLLGAVVDAGAPLPTLQEAVDAVGVEPVRLRAEPVTRAGIGALRVHVEVTDRAPHRTWGDVRGLLAAAPLHPAVRSAALEVFGRLAGAEAAVHRVPAQQVHFHEVGALDAVADVVGVCAGLQALGLLRGDETAALTASPVAIGSGSTGGAHGPLPVPVPAVLALLAGAPVHAGLVAHEACTPTGAALLAGLVAGWGPLPAMVPGRVGTGAGGRDPSEAANVVRLVLGAPLPAAPVQAAEPEVWLQETNVDDLDPRVWPGVLAALLAAGALDAWLTPILMKKGRPAHQLSVLAPPGGRAGLRRLILMQTSTLGVRERAVERTVLVRDEQVVEVHGRPVRVKRGHLDGEVVTRQPEWEDVAAVAAELGLPARQVLALALALAHAPPDRGAA